MKTKAIFTIAGVATALATVLRCIQMLFFFNDETGFFTDSGIFTYLYCSICILAGATCMLLCARKRETCGIMQRGRSLSMGVATLFCALFLFYCAAVLFMDAYNYVNFGVTYCIEPAYIMDHVPFAALSALFGLAALIIAVCWMRGRKLPGSIGAVWALGSVWGLYYMVVTFMTYSAVATTQESLFTVGGGAWMLLFLLSEGKMLSGVGGRKASRGVFVFGLPAAMFWTVYVLSNTALILFGRGYATEMPYVIQIVMFSLSIHAVTLLFNLKNPELFVPSQAVIGCSERKHEREDA